MFSLVTNSQSININNPTIPTTPTFTTTTAAAAAASSQLSDLNSSLTMPRSRAPIVLTSAVSKTAEAMIFNQQMNELTSASLTPSSVTTTVNPTNGNELFTGYNNGIYNFNAAINGNLIVGGETNGQTNENPYIYLAANTLNTKGIC